jgi:anti-sigma regulatory factor (Ser/Thr protein kinase)
LLHAALIYDADSEMLAAMVPFLREGLAAGDRTMVFCNGRNAALLSDALGADPRLGFLMRTNASQRLPRAIAGARDLVERELAAGVGRLRVVGDVDVLARARDWTRFEAVVNRALAPYPMWMVCMYDRRRLSAELIAAAELVHPTLVGVGTRRSSRRFVDPAKFLRRTAVDGPEPIEATRPVLVVDDPVDLYLLRARLHTALREAALSAEAVHQFVFAISEVTTNALLHGSAPVRVRLWSDGADRWLCAVSDRGRGFDDPFAGYLPAGYRTDARGMGLWLARQFCDQVTMTTTPGGFTVRLSIGPDRGSGP